MNSYKTFIGLIILAICNISICQEKKFVPKQFLNSEEIPKLPDVIKDLLLWPSDQEIKDNKVSISTVSENQMKKTISQCLNASLYDPNSPPALISLSKWPGQKSDPNIPTNIMQYLKGEYIINIQHSIGSISIGIKRVDGNDIWDMSRDHTEFVPWAINKFFVNQNVGLQKGKQMHYVCDEKGNKDFYYAYLTLNTKDFGPAYMWTNGKILVLRVDQLFKTDKKRAGKKGTEK